MIELRNTIPTLTELTQITGKDIMPPPDPVAVAEIENYLDGCNYTRQNPAVFDAIANYGAKLLTAKWQHYPLKGLFLKGAPGIGKTLGVKFLAAKFGIPVLTAREIQAAYTASTDELSFLAFIDAKNFFDEFQMLIIDDLGTEDCPVNHFGTSTNVLAVALERRYCNAFLRHNCITIVTTNLTDEQLVNRYGVRIDDRLNEMFEFKTVNGKSMR